MVWLFQIIQVGGTDNDGNGGVSGNLVVPFQGVDGIVGGTDEGYICLADQAPGSHIRHALEAFRVGSPCFCWMLSHGISGRRPANQSACCAAFSGEATGATILVVTHELESIFRISDRSIMLDAKTKKILADGPPLVLREESDIEAVRFFLNRGKL